MRRLRSFWNEVEIVYRFWGHLLGLSVLEKMRDSIKLVSQTDVYPEI